MNSTSGGKVVGFEPLHFENAESCLQLTLHTLNLNVKDAEFLEKAMRVYADLRFKEQHESQSKK